MMENINDENNNDAPSNTIMLELMKIHRTINSVKEGSQQQHIRKYLLIVNQVIQALHGVQFNFIRNAEFYSDLKETLVKINMNLRKSTKRKFISRILMFKHDSEIARMLQEHVDVLVGRILFFYAQQRNIR